MNNNGNGYENGSGHEKPKSQFLDTTDHFADIEKFKISQNFNETVLAKKATLHIPVRKVNRHEFVWVNPDPSMRMQAAVIELKEEREIFLVVPEIIPQLPNEVTPKLLLTTINRQGVLFLWPIGLDLDEKQGRRNHWNATAMEAADLATKGWVRVASNISLGAYEVYKAMGNLPPPEWPDLTFQQILKIAFKDNLITSADHVVIRKLLGEV